MATRKDKVGRSKASREEKIYTAPTSQETETSQAPMGHQDGMGTSGVTVPEVLQAQAQSGSDATSVQTQATVTSPWEQMLAERRKTLAKEKTDAQKMQKYYALSDALKTLGQMGGAAIGGAIGGETLAGAAVPEFKQHRGYIDAFEKAKEANEALRKLDDAEFQLKYKDMEKADERAYTEAREKASRDFTVQQNELARQFQSEQARITREWNKAVAEQNLERQAALRQEQAEIEHGYRVALQNLAHKNDLELKEASADIVGMQMSGGLKNSVPLGFKDGTALYIPKAYYDSMVQYFLGEDRGDGKELKEENLPTFFKNNPDKVKAYLKRFGIEGTPVANGKSGETPAATSYPPAYGTPSALYGYGYPFSMPNMYSDNTDWEKAWSNYEVKQ